VTDALEVRQWVGREVRSEDVEVLTSKVLYRVVRSSANSLLAIFVQDLEQETPGEAHTDLANFHKDPLICSIISVQV
jgi:hypothetical protein